MTLSLASKLKEEISSLNISISEFERRAGIARGTVQNILLGKSKSPSIKTISAIATALNCSTEELMKSVDEGIYTSSKNSLNIGILKVCTTGLLKKLEKMDVDLSLNEYFSLVRDLYAYQTDNPKKNTLDDTFLNWIIKKNLNIS